MNHKFTHIGVPVLVAAFVTLLVTCVWIYVTTPVSMCCTPISHVPLRSESLDKYFATTSQIDVSNWKTYRNEEYGFEFQYPDEFRLEEHIGDEEIQLYLVKKNNIGEKYSYINLEIKKDVYSGDIINWYNRCDGCDISKYLQSRILKIDGREAFLFKGYLGGEESGVLTEALVFNQGYVFRFANDYEKYEKELFELLASVVFTK